MFLKITVVWVMMSLDFSFLGRKVHVLILTTSATFWINGEAMEEACINRKGKLGKGRKEQEKTQKAMHIVEENKIPA